MDNGHAEILPNMLRWIDLEICGGSQWLQMDNAFGSPAAHVDVTLGTDVDASRLLLIRDDDVVAGMVIPGLRKGHWAGVANGTPVQLRSLRVAVMCWETHDVPYQGACSHELKRFASASVAFTSASTMAGSEAAWPAVTMCRSASGQARARSTAFLAGHTRS